MIEPNNFPSSEEQVTEDETIMAIAGVFYALCAALPDESAREAKEILLSFADKPTLDDRVQAIFRLIGDTTSAEERPQLQLITGGKPTHV